MVHQPGAQEAEAEAVVQQGGDDAGDEGGSKQPDGSAACDQCDGAGGEHRHEHMSGQGAQLRDPERARRDQRDGQEPNRCGRQAGGPHLGQAAENAPARRCPARLPDPQCFGGPHATGTKRSRQRFVLGHCRSHRLGWMSDLRESR